MAVASEERSQGIPGKMLSTERSLDRDFRFIIHFKQILLGSSLINRNY